MLKLVSFIVGSAFLAYVSRDSLHSPGAHGFYRFLAWECMLALFLSVVGRWFLDPFSLAQLVSWFLLLVSAFLVLYGVYLLQQTGHAGQGHRDGPSLEFEKTSTLVTTGVYRYIRHPLYSSLLFLTWGMFFKNPSPLAAGLSLVTTLFLNATAKADESECVHYFGDDYRQYMRRTKRFIPYLF
jgi:protein-S-isoprenylcysteine O-methyltransferase Ste14